MAILVVISLPGLVRAQSDADAAPVILLHPGVATVFQLPDAVAHARVHDRGEIRLAVVGDELFVRPRPGTPAGMTALLEVETRTARWTFQLVVVARARDARWDVPVPPVEAPALVTSTPEAPAETSAAPETPPPAAPAVPATRTAEAPAASAPSPVPAPAAPEPASAADDERTAATAISRRFDLSVHAVGGLGFTGANVAKYEPLIALQRHHSLGLRLMAAPRNTWWAVHADVNAEWPAGPMLYEGPDSIIEMSGTRLRLEVITRASVGTEWAAAVFAGLGVQAHLRRLEETDKAFKSTLEQGAVLTLGVGLQHRTRRKILLGLDLLVRQGGLDDYRSVAALLTVGRFLNQGD